MNSVYIEITNVCNLHCSFCPCGKEPTSRTFMDSKLFETSIAGAQEIGATNVYFHVLGEPTLHPGFAHYVKKLEQTPLKLTLTTNGTTIERSGRQILASPAVRQVNFSTHAYAELPRETAERYLQNVLDFCSLAIVERPDLYINLRLWNVGADEASPWNSYMLKRIHETFGIEITPGHFCSRHKSFNITGRLYLHEDTRFEWPSIDERTSKALQTRDERFAGTCRALDTHIAILHDGRVVACCLDHSGQITLGHTTEQNLAEILESPLAQNIKEGFAQHELRHPFCQTCSFCKRFK
ncbi:radical SAM/SPASM domain-containing protein [Fibrobacter sp. UWB13]|uniref:radical SAM/SPASM domain-containing protein n=1 Tax=Fibrobacter sp. UWB13 TaxID=1896204 RepID=UPI000A0B8D6B|nr:radical SAM/SPASM domain-containing protein [Fibrobacter sp. UWB13]SMG17628.1 radical SAM additional 4Fe4S-binding SPASM domain-containing protein [Fibrobacter sp. UWB13]